jgi:tripartite-type tricarboxylate transporter receptor subunit TctC
LDVPTVSEAGGPKNFELKTWVAVYALRGTPKAAIEKFNQETLTALKDPEVQKNMSTFGFEPWLVGPTDVAKDADIQSKKFEIVVKQAKMSIE